MDIGKAFTYVFEDPNWIMKVLIGGIVGLIPIVDFAALGYMLTTLKNIADGQPNPLPEWSDFGDHFMRGLYAVVGSIIYFLPLILLACCVFLLSFGPSLGATDANSQGPFAGPAIIGMYCFGCLGLLYLLLASLTLPAPLTRFAMSANQLSIFWDFRGNIDFVRKNLSSYIIALLVSWVAGFVASFGLILICVGALFTSFWAQLVFAYLFGQLWRNQGTTAAPAMA